ncbi:hypothetical protein ACGTN9_05930 [Halobacillus sp. MO56]
MKSTHGGIDAAGAAIKKAIYLQGYRVMWSIAVNASLWGVCRNKNIYMPGGAL